VDYKCRWKQHLLRMNSTCTPKSAHEHIPTGRRKCTLTKEKTDRPMPMKTEQAWDGSHPVAAVDYYRGVPRNNSSHNTAHIIPFYLRPSDNPGCYITDPFIHFYVWYAQSVWHGHINMSNDVSSPELLTGLWQNLIMAVNITSHQYNSCLSILVNYDIYFVSC
jgi:hypothetical protein